MWGVWGVRVVGLWALGGPGVQSLGPFEVPPVQH